MVALRFRRRTDRFSFLDGEPRQTPQYLGQRAFLAQVMDAPCLQLLGVADVCQLLQGFRFDFFCFIRHFYAC